MHPLARIRFLLTAWRRSDAVFDRYRESELTRLANLFAHVDLARYKGMKVLEVGAGLGRLGEAFALLGFDVTSSDGRPEHVEQMRRVGRKAVVLDLDRQVLRDAGRFDIVLAFGVLYHLREPRQFLLNCAEMAQVLFLESVVCDREAAVLDLVEERTGRYGRDQALHGTGCRPSCSWVENTCREAGFEEVRDISSGLANWSTGIFDWKSENDGATRRGGRNLRRMWVASKARRGGAP